MNWLFGNRRSNLPEPTALQTQKAKQTEQLKTFNQNVVEIHRDVEYRVNFIVANTNFSLDITLPPQFPHEKPVVKLSPPAHHQWLNDQYQVVGSQGINTFAVHSDLGKVIRHLVEEFQRNPPTLISQPTPYPSYGIAPPLAQPPTLQGYPAYRPPTLPGQMPMPTLPTAGPPAPPSGPPGPQALPPGAPAAAAPIPYPMPPQSALSTSSGGATSYQMPEVPASFPQIHALSVSELRQLMDDEDRLLEIISGLNEIQKLTQDRQDLTQKNEQLARENLSKKPILDEKKREILEKYDVLNDIKVQFEESCNRQESMREQFDVQTLQMNLKVAALQAEEHADAIAEKFIDGETPVEEFTKKYLQAKKTTHILKIKEEKLARGGF